MSNEVQGGMIHQSIVAIMEECPAIAKDQQADKYKFRGIEQLYNTVQPLFKKHGVYSVSTILNHEHKSGKTGKGTEFFLSILKMRYTFYAKDGSHVESEVVGEGMDYGGDKASNKAMSAAQKYAVFQLLMIPTMSIDSEREPNENPDYNEDAPKAPSRGERQSSTKPGPVKKDDAIALFTLFSQKHSEYHPDDMRYQFKLWVKEITKSDFDATIPMQWTREAYDKCKAQLEAM